MYLYMDNIECCSNSTNSILDNRIINISVRSANRNNTFNIRKVDSISFSIDECTMIKQSPDNNKYTIFMNCRNVDGLIEILEDVLNKLKEFRNKRMI